MHSPTLIVLAALLSALITVVLFALWFFNRHIPGLRLWVLSFFFASLFAVSLLARERLPELLAVVFTQASVALAAYWCFLGARAYMGRAPISHAYGLAALCVVLGASLYFTFVHPSPSARFMVSGLIPGACFLWTAHTMARGGAKRFPARYLFGALVGAHGVFVLLRPLLFSLAAPAGLAGSDASFVAAVSQFVVVESTMALVLIAFGTVLLTNEFITNELRHLAEVDPLTTAFNRRAFLTLLDKAMSNAQRTETPLPVMVIDLDHFKKINDSWGHHVGDDVLRHFVRLALRCLRKEDVLGRLGGEEFAIFLPNADAAGARAVAERLRALVDAEPVAVREARSVPVTVSVGIALGMAGDTPGGVLQRADRAMYRAKELGRNRVEVQEGTRSGPGDVLAAEPAPAPPPPDAPLPPGLHSAA